MSRPAETVVGLRHGPGGKIYAVVDDRWADHHSGPSTYSPETIEEMTPARARSLAEDLIRRADEVDPNSFVPTIWRVNPEDVEQLADYLAWAAKEARSIRVMIDDGIKVDVGDGSGWSLPHGTKEPRHG